ncbi:MAG: ABC transporter permease [Gammaproteobacteria bacterium]|nr:ABC transporter permease [Gammaproteobacteria bacterium]
MKQGYTLIFALAWRNLWRNPRRTIVILFAIVLGAWAMIVMAAYSRGMSQQVFNNAIDNLLGHIQIHAPGYLEDPVIDRVLDTQQPALKTALLAPEIQHTAARVRVPAVVASERDSQGVTLLGIDPAAEADMSFIRKSVTLGKYFEGNQDGGIILGKKLVERLETSLGRRVVLMTQNSQNKIADRGFRIVGIFDTMIDAQETSYAFITLGTAQQMLDLGTNVSEIAVKLSHADHTDKILGGLRAGLPGLDVKPWYTLDALTKLFQDTWEGSAFVWYLIVFLAMGFGIVNTILMAVFERTREFGLFQALGLKPNFILLQVWLESLLLLTTGLAIGNLVSWLTVLATGDGIDVSAFSQGMEMVKLSKIIPFVLTTDDLVVANAVVLILGLLTCLYPAWRAARLVPAHAITRV